MSYYLVGHIAPCQQARFKSDTGLLKQTKTDPLNFHLDHCDWATSDTYTTVPAGYYRWKVICWGNPTIGPCVRLYPITKHEYAALKDTAEQIIDGETRAHERAAERRLERARMERNQRRGRK